MAVIGFFSLVFEKHFLSHGFQKKVKEINYLHDYYYEYLEALHILNPEEDTFGVDSEDANDYW